MNTLFSGALLSALTLATVGAYPCFKDKAANPSDVPVLVELHAAGLTNSALKEDSVGLAASLSKTAPVIDVVFVLDTTGSMEGLIDTAKEKIWSIANTMTSAQQAPDIRIGLVAYRDRGEDYVTQVVDLSDDIDSVYATLMDFEAEGGGDSPESVNQALLDAINKMSWSQNRQAYQTVFLVGDAEPHMDYPNDTLFPEILAQAKRKNIIVNAIQCGNETATTKYWQQIASIGGGRYFLVEQAGGAIAVVTPFDEAIANLSVKLDDTRLYYGSTEDKARMHDKVVATEKLHRESSIISRARRGVFNSTASGKKNQLGDNELVEAVISGSVSLEELEQDDLPKPLQAMKPEEQREEIASIAKQRKELENQIADLASERNLYLKEKVETDGDTTNSLDQQLYDTVREQAAKTGLEYKDGPAY
ncbi:MAG: vWA domain-containing protein [Granulosicoccus sp.]